jgi:hypothetical protein
VNNIGEDELQYSQKVDPLSAVISQLSKRKKKKKKKKLAGLGSGLDEVSKINSSLGNNLL